ncbi:MAG: segregation and condensation protein A [Gammaproteobacteria bacterium]
MSADEPSQEERILRMMKKVLTDVAKDTHAKPGFRHSLSEHTIQGIRECLAQIAARERELVEARGGAMDLRPRFIDEPKKTVVVPLEHLSRKPPGPTGNDD